ncbi:MAG TPA: Cof-type HAD-IIB family hydrolase [Motilibacteraceae bacterium]|nr:Cof-type HAD-IIB family hydrolase [Motilibacteraceae bacterium]
MTRAPQASQAGQFPGLVATDLDGTVVRSDGTLSDRTVAALRAAQDAGCTVVFVTGRPPRWMRPIAERTGHAGLAVCANGALVYDLSREEVVESFPLSTEVALEIALRLRGALPGAAFAVESPAGFAREPGYLVRFDVGDHGVGELEELLDAAADGAVKMLVRVGDGADGRGASDVDTLLAAAREVLGDLAEVTHSTPTGPPLLEVSAPGVSKATTLARLAAERGLTAADVLAFGDMPNDLPMLAWAGLSVAVANAHPEVLAAADHVTRSNDDDGVAYVLEHLLSHGTLEAWTSTG